MDPVLPEYGGPCLDGLVPALLGRDSPPAWLPAEVAGANQVVLLVLDGLGSEQLRERPALAPTLTGLPGRSITSVVPSTTTTALTSIVMGRPPALHGVVGYRVRVGADVLNVLRWTTPAGDARGDVPPDGFAAGIPFGGEKPAVVTRAEFAGTGFTAAHLLPSRLHGYRVTSTLVVEVRRLLADGEQFVYAYYDGIDRVAHPFGLGEHYDAELRAADALVADLLDALPPGAALVVSADHGQVEVGERTVPLDAGLLGDVAMVSGEGRFRWLHARRGREAAVAERAAELYGAQAWVRTRAQAESEGWFGGPLGGLAASRLGDVVLAPFEPVAFDDPADTGERTLVSRHGSLTAAEMWVPLLVGRG